MNKQERSNDMSERQTQALEAKLRRFADALTPEERAEVRALQPHDVTGMISPSLRAKAQQATDELTTAEVAQLGLLLERAGVAATSAGEAEVRGYRVAQYEDAYGWKGPIGTGGESLPPAGGSNTIAGISLGLLAALAVFTLGGPAVGVYQKETGQIE
jgi:hypothetical protein